MLNSSVSGGKFSWNIVQSQCLSYLADRGGQVQSQFLCSSGNTSTVCLADKFAPAALMVWRRLTCISKV